MINIKNESADCFVASQLPQSLMCIRKSLRSFHSRSFFPHTHKTRRYYYESTDCFVASQLPQSLMCIRKSLRSFHSRSFFPHTHQVALCPIEYASELAIRRSQRNTFIVGFQGRSFPEGAGPECRFCNLLCSLPGSPQSYPDHRILS